MASLPDVTTVRGWANVTAQSLTDEQIEQIIDAEAALQGAVCRYASANGDMPAALAQALLRRCAREISARQLPLGLTADTSGEYAPVRLPNFDAEINRLEAPYRIVAVA
jgi:hypothetical protein